MALNADKISNSIIGAAGEHYVVSQILRMGHLAALAPTGAPNSDVIVTDINSKKLCTIQVKTRSSVSKKIGWHMNKKHEKITFDNLYYCFVALGSSYKDAIKAYVVPAKKVAYYIEVAHAIWINSPGIRVKERKNTPHRLLKLYSKPHFSSYLDFISSEAYKKSDFLKTVNYDDFIEEYSTNWLLKHEDDWVSLWENNK